MTRTELLTHLATLTPTQRRAVLAMARTIRAALGGRQGGQVGQ